MTSAPKESAEKKDSFMVRVPEELRTGLAKAARANGRSLNAEIVSRLRRSLEQENRDVADPFPGSGGSALALIPSIHHMVTALYQATNDPLSTFYTGFSTRK